MEGTPNTRTRRFKGGFSLGALLAFMAGAALIVGSLFTWSSVRFGKGKGGKKATAISGLHLLDGRVVLGLGIAILVAAVLAWVLSNRSHRAIALGCAAALGAVGLALTITSVISPAAGSAIAAVKPKLANHIHATAGLGLWLALGGSGLGVIGGALGLMRTGRRPVTGTAPAAGSARVAEPTPDPAPTAPMPSAERAMASAG